MQQISTSEWPISERSASYTAALGRCFSVPFELRSELDAEFRCMVEQAPVIDLGMFSFNASRHSLQAVKRQLSGSAANFAKIAVQLKGTSCFEQEGRQLTLYPGEWSLYNLSKPYRVDLLEDVEMLLVMLPLEMLRSRQFSLENVTLKRFSRGEGIPGLAYSFIRDTFRESPNIRHRSAVDIVEILSNLVRLALSDDSDGMACPVPQEVLCERIKDYIAKNLRNPNLSVAHIAEALRYSPRYLQKAFERQGITISSYVSQARLGRCYHDLQNPLLRNESITGIAFSWGFNSSAHFSRSFREHFGVSPHIARNEGPKLYAATSA